MLIIKQSIYQNYKRFFLLKLLYLQYDSYFKRKNASRKGPQVAFNFFFQIKFCHRLFFTKILWRVFELLGSNLE